MFIALEPVYPIQDSETVVVTAIAPSRKDTLTQGVVVVDRDHTLLHSMSGGIGETLSGHTGIRASFYGPNASRPIIRGLGEDRIRVLTNGLQGVDASTISPDHAPALDGLEAQSIEVLKGAAALRFGANAVGGVVNLIDGRFLTKLPNQPIIGDIFVGASSVDKGNTAAAKLNFTKGNFVFGIDGLHKKSSDYDINGYAQTKELRDSTGDESRNSIFNSHGKNQTLGANVNYIADKFNIGVAVRDQKSEYGIPNEEAHIKLEQQRADFNVGVKLNGLIESVNLSSSSGDYSHSEIEDTGEIGTIFNVNGYESRIEARHKKMMNFNGIIGVQWSNKDFEAIGEEAFILPVNSKNSGIFIVEHFENEKWGGEFGARSERTEYKGAAGNRDFNSQSASLNIFAKPISGLKIGVLAGVTERIPTETELFANGPHAATQSFEIGAENLTTEIAKSIELALRYRNVTNELEINIWRANFDNFIAFQNTGDIEDDLPVYQATQKDAELNGFEAQYSRDFGAILNGNIIADIGVDYVRGKYKIGENIARMPPMSFIFGIDYNFSQFNTRAEIQHFTKQDKLGAFETSTDSATTINLAITYKPKNFEHLEIRLMGQNLTDEIVREHTSILKDTLPKPGRNLKIAAHYKF